MKLAKKICALICSLALLISMAAVCGLSVSAYTGGGMKGYSDVAILGADLSYWNVGGDDLNYSYVDFQKMYNDGCKFVILRIGYEASASRADTMDKAFLKFYEMARQVEGLKIGVYFYSLAYSYDAAKQDAQWVIEQIEKNNMYFEYPIYYDVEDPGNGTSSRPGHSSLTSSQMTSLCLGWAETMEEAGYFPGVYGGETQTADKLITGEYADRYDMWLANYGSTDGGYNWNSRDFRSKAGMWQYCSTGHNFDGLTLDFMDASVSYKDYASIIESQGLNNCASGHTVVFDSNGGSQVASQIVKDGETLTKPADPSKYGFTFDGWYCNPELTDPYDFNTPVPYSFTLYAKWNEAYWNPISSLMPVEGKLEINPYNDAGDKVWAYWNTADASVDMYSGVEGWAWPSASMSYENSVDSVNDTYIYLKKDGTAQFNAIISYLDADGVQQSVYLSELAGKEREDFEAGYQEFFVDFGQYVRQQGQVPASGNIKIVGCTYFVIGEKDSYVKLYDLKFTSKFAISDPYISLYGGSSGSITQDGQSGSYVYNDGVLTMSSAGTDFYSVTFTVEKDIAPNDMKNLLMDISSTVPFNVTMRLDCNNNTADMEFRREFYNCFELDTTPTALPAGDWKVNMNLAGYYEWNGGMVDSSTIHSVTVTIYGSGTLTLSALQVSRVAVINYVHDGLYAKGSISVDIPQALTSDVYTVSNPYISRVAIGTTVGVLRGGFDQDASYIVVYDNGTKAADTDVIKTGMTIALVANDAILREYTVAVVGDIKGTGTITTGTARELLQLIASTEQLDTLTALAADYDGNGSFNTADIRRMLFDLVSNT